ncbi:MAG TPA: MFS transporter [Kofleriaceae bacterium]|nr:MFS transporter [Kofleriaceae bacterium]
MSAPPGPAPVPRLALLRKPGFVLLVAGQGVSLIGDAALRVALIVYVIQRTGSAGDLGLVTAAFMLPNLLTFFVSGAVIDRLPRRTVMLASDAARTALTAILAALATTTDPPLALVAALYALFGVGDAFFLPAYRAYLPQILEREALYAANAVDAMARRGGLILGPVVGALVVERWSAAAAFWVDAATFAISVLSLLAIRVRRAAPAEAKPAGGGARAILREATAGVRYLRAARWLGLLTVSAAIVNAGAAASMDVVLPFLVRGEYGERSSALGALYAVQAGGALIGAVAAGLVGARLRRPAVAAPLVLALMGLSVAGLALTPAFPALVALGLLYGFAVESAGVVVGTLLQVHVPDAVLGRVSAIDYLISYSLMPLGVLLIGAVLPAIGVAAAFATTGAVMVLAAAAPLLAAKPTHRPLDEATR